MNQNNIYNSINQNNQDKEQKATKTRRLKLTIIGIAVLVIGLVGVTYAFFNYTRTGTSNVIKTGKMSFNSTQGNSINLTNMFPIDVSQGIPNDATKVGTVTINVTGDTTYNDGIEYLVSAVNVQNTVNSKSLPISIDVSVANNTNNDPATTLGTADNSYYTNRGGNSSIYKVLASNTITNNDQLLVGYITKGATGVDGNIVIKAYLDKAKVGISDTYPEEETDTNNDGYIDGTPASFGTNRTIFTTTEWNSLQQNGVSFQIKVEANEGTWILAPTPTPEPIPTIPSCPDCVYIFPTDMYDPAPGVVPNPPLYATWNTLNETPTVLNSDQYVEDYRLMPHSSRFMGVVLNANHEIEKAYMCYDSGYSGRGPVCAEGYYDTSKKEEIESILNASEYFDGECDLDVLHSCGDFSYSSGGIYVGDSSLNCGVDSTGAISCDF